MRMSQARSNESDLIKKRKPGITDVVPGFLDREGTLSGSRKHIGKNRSVRALKIESREAQACYLPRRKNTAIRPPRKREGPHESFILYQSEKRYFKESFGSHQL